MQLFGLDGTVTLQTKYHALSTDAWDAADLAPGPHQGTYASSRRDGHGRAVETTERVHDAEGEIEARHVRMAYLPSGAVSSITRVKGSDSVKRWMRYDTQDRMVLNADAHVTDYWSDNETVAPGAMNAPMYAYSDSGARVGTTDARGCGQTFFYDAGGRMLAEDYSPCTWDHPDWTPVDLATGDGAEVFYRYDTPDADADLAAAEDPTCVTHEYWTNGRVGSISDRAGKTWMYRDILGRVVCVAKRLAPPGPVAEELADRYTGRVYTQTSTYDAEERPVTVSTGVRSADLLGIGARSEVTTTYANNGTVKSVGGSYGTLVAQIHRAADGPIERIVYGDVLGTTTDFTHDNRRRVATVQTYRGPPPLGGWDNTDGTQQLLLQDLTYAYDEVDNPTEIRDWRIASEWPTGAKPVSRTMEYDDLYRVKRVDYRHHGISGGGADGWVDPHEEDNAGATDARRATPAPHGTYDKRMQAEWFFYDWLGNRTGHADDKYAFWDRSAGAISHGYTRRYAPVQAYHGGVYTGVAQLFYDQAGNTTEITLTRSAPCAGGGTACEKTKYTYVWDEVNRLQEARREDGISAAFGARLKYSYDVGDNRVRKTVVDAGGDDVSHSLYIFPSLELRGATVVGGDFELTPRTEVGYLFGHGVRLARLHVEDAPAVASIADESLHVLLELPDHLGSTSIVLDRNSSELVEAGSYTASGGAETDYRPGKWKHFRADYRFTGKEDDLEGGVTYFGKRYLIPALGTWASPDPLAVHSPGKADLNLYAYVSGQLLRAVDPVGLEGEGGAPANYTPATPPLSTSGSTKAAQGDLSSTECTIPMNCATAQADAATQFVGGAAIGATKAMTTIAGAVQHPIETAKVAGPAAAKMVAVLLPSAYNPARDDFVASTAARASAAVGEHYERGTLPQLAGELTGEGAVYTAAGAGVGSAFRAAGPVLRTMAIDSASMATGTLPGSLGRGGAFLVQDVKNTFVYQLVDDVGEAVYYGVTDNPGVRLGGHVEEFGNGFRGMQVISRGVPEAQGRALETSLIEGAKAAGRPIWNIAETSNFKGAAASGIEIPSTIGPSQTMLNPAIYTPRLANQASGSDHGMV